jgi:hypothetical protein
MTDIADNTEPKPRAKKAAYLELLDDVDQQRVRADLTTFFGPRTEVFLDTYEKMRLGTGTRRTAPKSWSWPVFLGSFTWFFYRKMYAYGAMIIILPIILGYLFGSAGSALPILFALWAKGWYVTYALNRIVKADKLGLTNTERTDYLQRAGGVSLPAGIFAGLLYAALLALIILGATMSPKAGH